MMFSLPTLPEMGRAFTAGTGKTALSAVWRYMSKEAPKQLSSAQEYAVSVARSIGAEAPKRLERARSYIGEAAAVVVTQTPRHVHAVQQYAGEAAEVVAKKAPLSKVGAVGGYVGGIAKAVVTEGPRRLGSAGVVMVDAAKKADARRYGKAVAGGASSVGRRIGHIAKESSVAAAAMGAGLVAVAVPSTVTTPFMTAAGMLGPRAGDVAAEELFNGQYELSNGSSADETHLDAVAGEPVPSSVRAGPALYQSPNLASGFGLAIVNGVAQIVGGAAAVAGGLFGLVGHVFSGRTSGVRAPDGDEEQGKQKLR